MSVTYSAAKIDASNNYTWLTDDDTSLNVSNSNHSVILFVLGREHDYCGRIEGEELQKLRDRANDLRPYVNEYLDRRLKQLVFIADIALANGASLTFG